MRSFINSHSVSVKSESNIVLFILFNKLNKFNMNEREFKDCRQSLHITTFLMPRINMTEKEQLFCSLLD